MDKKPLIKQGYSLAEEIANSISHGVGFVLGLSGWFYCWFRPLTLMPTPQRSPATASTAAA